MNTIKQRTHFPKMSTPPTSLRSFPVIWRATITVMMRLHGSTRSEPFLKNSVTRRNQKTFKKNPDLYKGHVGDVSTVIRIALMGRASSPDVWEIQQIMGEEMVRRRIGSALVSSK